MEWKDVLNTRCFLLNMDRASDRLDICMKRISNAGFTNAERYRGIDRDTDDLEKEWEKFGSPKFAQWDIGFHVNKGRQACALGHYGIWKKIIDENIEYAIIFEDDIEFHKYWSILGPEYWKITPKDFDILYLGSQLEGHIDGVIGRVPVFCTHAYMLSLEGTKKLYDLCLCSEVGTYTIDCLLIDHMRRNTNKFKWYVWKATYFYDVNAHKNTDLAKKNAGLVFQDPDFNSYILI